MPGRPETCRASAASCAAPRRSGSDRPVPTARASRPPATTYPLSSADQRSKPIGCVVTLAKPPPQERAVWSSLRKQDPRLVAYYAWCMAQIGARAAPERLLKGAGHYPQPVALLARLGVDISHERRGLGTGLLQDVIARVAELSTEIGCRGLLVHAESIEARDFYTHLIPEFERSPSDDLHLVLLTKDIHRTLRG